jgi:hypothetical protein
MATVMNMSGYDLEREVVAVEEYGDEVMCAGWNPQLALVGDRPIMESDRHVSFPSELANVDIDAFLQQMYKYQR